MNLETQTATAAAEVGRISSLVATAPDEYVSITATFGSLKAVAGGFAIYEGVMTPYYYVHGVVGGLAAGLDAGGGKLTVAKRINKKGYTGSCSVFMVAIVAGYFNVIGYDEHATPVLWFNGGGVGLDAFAGGGRFEIDNPLPMPAPTPTPEQPSFIRKDAIASILERDIRIAVPSKAGETGHYWEVENSSKTDGARIQLWDSDAPAKVWQLIPAGTDKNGHDLFKMYNTKLRTYATYWFEWGKDRINGFPLTSCSARQSAQAFKISRDSKGRYAFYVTDTAALVREDGNTGNSTKIISYEIDARNWEASLWAFELI